MKERRRCVDRAAVEVLAAVEVGDQLRQSDRVDLVDAARARVVADLRRVAGDREDVADTFCVRAEQHRLEAHHRPVARREMRDRLEPALALDRRRHHERAHAGARRRVVVDVDESDASGLPQCTRGLDQARAVRAQRRIELDGDDPFVLAQRAGEAGLALLLAERDDELPLVELERRARLTLFLDRGADRGDLCRRRPATAADHLRAEIACMRRELGEVLRRRVRIDDAAPGEAREADVRERGERLAVLAHPFERGQSGEQPGAVVRADRSDVEVG